MFNRKACWLMACSSLWTLVACLAALVTAWPTLQAAVWAIIVAIIAALVTIRIMVHSALRRERLRLRGLAEIMARAAQEHSVPRIGRHGDE